MSVNTYLFTSENLFYKPNENLFYKPKASGSNPVYIDNKRVEMSPKEYDLLFYMLENRNVAVSREKFISDVWGYDFYGDVRTLDTHVKLLRKSLGRYSNMIVTLRGVGYRFEG